MFVCLGNICRSPLAQAVFDHQCRERDAAHGIVTESSGTCAYHVGELADPRMRAEAETHGITMTHRSRQLQPDDLDTWDLILAMDNDNVNAITAMATSPEQLKKIVLYRQFDPLSQGDDPVPDPYYGGPDGFSLVYDIIERTSVALLDTLLASTSD